MEHRAGRRGELEVTAEDARGIAGLLRYATSLSTTVVLVCP